MTTNTHPIETLIHEYYKAELELVVEARKALPFFLEMEDIKYGRPTESKNYQTLADACWFDSVDREDNEFTFESDSDYHYVPFSFIKDPKGHLQEALREAALKEAERLDRHLRLRNERINAAKETLRREGIDFLIIDK
jgi:hypothetical protein